MKLDPWSLVFTDLDTGAVLDVIDGRRGYAVRWWLARRPACWRGRIQVVAIDMSSEFRAAVRDSLPGVPIVADHRHAATEPTRWSPRSGAGTPGTCTAAAARSSTRRGSTACYLFSPGFR